jgi:hypothetical protein
MFDIANAPARPSFYEMEWRARHQRRAVTNALMHDAVRGFARWLRVLIRAGGRLARGLALQAKAGASGRTGPGIESRRSHAPINRSELYRTSGI